MCEEQSTASLSTMFAADASKVHQRTTKQTAHVANDTGTGEQYSVYNNLDSVFFMGHRQTVRRLIRVSTVCLQNALSKFE